MGEESFHLDNVLQVLWMDAGVVVQEDIAVTKQLLVPVLLLGGLQGAKHQCTHHQIQQHHRHDGQQGGAPHGSTALGSQSGTSWASTWAEMEQSYKDIIYNKLWEG